MPVSTTSCNSPTTKSLWMIDDIGSGALGPGRPPGIGDEPTAAAGIAAGADLVLFSGDKLLGGPQCGIMAGTARAVGRVESDPLMRALRLDKMTLAALEATLLLACDPERAAERIPLWSMISHARWRLVGTCQQTRGDLPLRARVERGGRAGRIVSGRRQRTGAADTERGRRRFAPVSDRSRFGSRAGPGLAAR